MSASIYRRTIHPEIRVIDSKRGIMEYVASDQTIDSYREVIMAAGWQHNLFAKNAPFVDSHDYSTIERMLGSVIAYEVKAKKLINTVQWAVEVEENRLARIGFRMVEAGHLKAVSVGFQPVRSVTRYSQGKEADEYQKLSVKLGFEEGSGPDRIFTEQEQVELSAVIIGANPNAVAKMARAYKEGLMDEADIEEISRIQFAVTEAEQTAREANRLVAAQRASQRRAEFLDAMQRAIKQIK